jgi:N-acetylneuraminic acid mutarotase
MPSARAILAAAAVNGKIYAIGGGYGSGGNLVALSTVEVYDPSTNTWSSAASMPTARSWLGATDVNGLIYAIGGLGAAITQVNTVEQYAPPVTIYTFVKN